MYETFSEWPIVPYFQWSLHLFLEKTSNLEILGLESNQIVKRREKLRRKMWKRRKLRSKVLRRRLSRRRKMRRRTEKRKEIDLKGGKHNRTAL
jgi:hypothetical protein